MAFGGEEFTNILIESQESKDGYFNLRIVDKSGSVLQYSVGVHQSSVDKDQAALFVELDNPNRDELITVRQELLEVEAHYSLGRDILITMSPFLLKNRNELARKNLLMPSEALKVVGLYLRSRNTEEWVIQVKGNVHLRIPRSQFYRYLARGLLPNSLKYVSGLPVNDKELFQLGLSVLDRCSRVLQARDEIIQLYLMPETSNSEDRIMYHFEYLTLLLTAVLDAETLIINKLFRLGLNDFNCGLKRSVFTKAIMKDNRTRSIANLLDRKKEFIEILFKLRNKIHSISLEKDFSLPENYQNDLFDRMYNFDPVSHWGIQKQKITLIENRNPPIPAYDISVDIYTLTHHLLDESFALIDDIMRETKVEATLDAISAGKTLEKPPPDLASVIELCIL